MAILIFNALHCICFTKPINVQLNNFGRKAGKLGMRFWGVNFWSRFFLGGGWGEGYFCPDSLIHINWNPQYPRERSRGCVEITAFCFHTSRSQYKLPWSRNPANGDRNPPPRNGSSDYPQGSMIRYTCYPHYNLHGPVTRTCLADGSWSKKAPECLSEYIERSLIKQPRFRDTTTGFPAKWRLRNDRRNSILMTSHYPDLGSAFNWLL